MFTITWLKLLFLILNLLIINASFLQNAFTILKNTGQFLNDVNDGITNFAKGLNTVQSVLDEATEEECIYRCPDGRKPEKNKHHVAIPNGCGSLGFTVPDDQLPVKDLRECCNEHDICYDTCNKVKEDCDKKFRKCLFKICEKHEKFIGRDLLKGCKAAAQAMYAGTMALGCKAYKDAQREACVCVTRKKYEL